MDTNEFYRRNNLYFFPILKKSKKNGVIAILIGIVVFLIGFGVGIPAIIIGLVLIAIGILLIMNVIKFNNNREIVTASELDKAAIDYLSDLKSRALKKLGIDEDEVSEAPPIHFHGYYFKKIQGESPYYKYENNRYRSSYYNAVMFLFSNKQVYCYEYRFSLLDDKNTVSTEEVFYRDIISVTTMSETENFGEIAINYENFNLKTAAGMLGATIFDLDENAVKAMKNKIREKKETQ